VTLAASAHTALAALGLCLTLGCETGPSRGRAATPLDDAARARLRVDLVSLADDEMEGRGLGQPGLARAIAYAAHRLEEAGTLPLPGPEGAPPSHLQAVPAVRYRYGDGNRLDLRGPGGHRSLRHGHEMVVLHAGRESPAVPAGPPVFIGFGISEPESGWDDYADLPVRDRLVLVMEGTPDNLPASIADVYSDPTRGPALKYQAALRHEVGGIIAIPQAEAFEMWALLVAGRVARSIAPSRSYAGGEIEDPELPVTALARDVLEDIFDGTGYDPVTRAGTYRTFVLAGYEAELALDARREPFISHNVLGLVEGTDPSLARELVVVSAHIDHLGVVDSEIRNGANDDASGCAVVLEVARRLAANPEPRPVLFVLFTAEESEHLGSLHFLAEPPLTGHTIVASLNLEHAGRSGDGTLLATASPTLMAVTEKVRETVAPGRLRTARLSPAGREVSGSDSYSFHLHGIPLIIVGGGFFPEYHGPGDDAALIDFDLLADATALSLALTRGLAMARPEGVLIYPDRSK